MPLLNWENKYNVNIGEIDKQHKKLFDLINELHEAMRVGKGKDILAKVLSDLINYTKSHFSTEEKFMKTQGFPDYSKHKSEHDNLTKQVLDFQKSFQENKIGMSIEIMNFLKKWLEEHILNTDKKLGTFLAGKGLK